MLRLTRGRLVRPLPVRRVATQRPRPGFAGLNAETPVEPGNSDLCFVWPGPIEDAVEHLGRCGIEVVTGPVDGDSGASGRGSHVYFRDPDGSLLEFVSYP